MFTNTRIIARLDIKNDFVIKGIQLEGLRKVGRPNEMALKYYQDGVDEIIFMDAVASLYERNNLFHIIKEASRNIFVPIALGGGLRTIDDVSKALDAGADKVVINTGCVENIKLAEDISTRYGSQCLVGSIEAKKFGNDHFAYIDNGREPTTLEVVAWSKKLENAGIGELLITSIDKEGTGKGFDESLIRKIDNSINCPLVISGGYGQPNHLNQIFHVALPSGIAFANVLHYEKSDISTIRKYIESIK
tara:strand:+ start:65 stop:808 length:744 start_codon:yes stop_codon:yes gene_type:complete